MTKEFPKMPVNWQNPVEVNQVRLFISLVYNLSAAEAQTFSSAQLQALLRGVLANAKSER